MEKMYVVGNSYEEFRRLGVSGAMFELETWNFVHFIIFENNVMKEKIEVFKNAKNFEIKLLRNRF